MNSNFKIRKVIVAVVISVIISTVMISLLALLISKGSISYKTGMYIVCGVPFVSLFVGSAVVNGANKENALIYNLIVLAAYFFVTLSLNILLFDGSFDYILINLISGVGGASIPIVLKVKSKNRLTGIPMKRRIVNLNKK